MKNKDESYRFWVNYRKLNNVTVKYSYPLPIINDTLDSLAGARCFSTLDLSCGHWQVGLTEEAKDKTAFIISPGLYQFKVLPFGLSNAPLMFERLMERDSPRSEMGDTLGILGWHDNLQQIYFLT